MKNKSYSELVKLKTFKERFQYLKLDGAVGEFTFNGSRFLNQTFYRSRQWNEARHKVILRDNGCEMGLEDYPIFGYIYIHHINPITKDDLMRLSPRIFDLENLICLSFQTHNAIHYGSEESLPKGPAIRTANDTCLWR